MSSEQTFVVRDERRRGFFMVFNDFYDQYGSKLGPYGLAVYMALCRYANREQECWPSQRRIAKDVGMCRKQVGLTLARLEELKLVAVERTNGTSNTYILLDTCEPDSQGCESHSQGPENHIRRVVNHTPHISISYIVGKLYAQIDALRLTPDCSG